MLNRVAVLSTAPVATFLALLFELLLSLGVGKTKEEFDSIMISEHAVVLLDDTLRNISALESAHIRGMKRRIRSNHLPCKSNLLADTRGSITTNLG